MTGADRTASTPTETPASPAPRPSTTGTVGAPTVAVAPEPAAATASPAYASSSAETDREALVALYNATDGLNWRYSADWLRDAPLGDWGGVTTARRRARYSAGTRIQQLARGDTAGAGQPLQPDRSVPRHGNDLSGEIPPELGSLSNLTDLSLHGNDLSGEIPPELGSLSNLTDLSLHHNELSGEIPPELGSLSNADISAPPLQPDKSAPPLQRLERVCAKQPGRPVDLL